MKKILLSSAAVALLAGAASAEVTWSGDADFGYNDDVVGGVYFDAGLTVAMSQELNNGWTASGSLDVDLQDDAGSTSLDLGNVSTSDWVLSVSNDQYGLSVGDVDFALASFDFVSGVDEMTANDNAGDFGADAGVLLTGDLGAFSFAASTAVIGGDTSDYQAWVGGEFGMVNFGLVYTDDADVKSTLVSLGTSLGGADLTVNAGQVNGFDVYGLGVSYPVGDVTVGAYYTVNKEMADDTAYGASVNYAAGAVSVAAHYDMAYGDEGYGLEASYDLGNGLVVGAGYIGGVNEGNDQATYVVAEYDLGGGASFLASYADSVASQEGSDDIDTGLGGYELNDGLTLELSLSF